MRRKMQRNERSGCPTAFVAFDTETRIVKSASPGEPTVNVFWLGHAKYWRMENGRATRELQRDFKSASEMIWWIYNRGDERKRTWVFSHNLGFDLTALRFWKWLEEKTFLPVWRARDKPDSKEPTMNQRLDSACIVLEDPPTILDLQTAAGCKFCFVDLLNYFPIAASELGEMIGLPQVPKPGDEADEWAWMQRCRRDVEIVKGAVIRLWQMVKADDLGNMRYTMTGQSMALYRHRCMTEDIVLGHDDGIKEQERECYYGMGPTCYFIGHVATPLTLWTEHRARGGMDGRYHDGGPIYRLDVNSCYPFVMSNNCFPVEYLHSHDSLTVEELANRLATMEGFARVTVESANRVYPCREDGETRWLTGRFSTVLAGPELRRAIADRDVISVNDAHFYRSAKPFGKFCDTVWKLKRKYARKGMKLEALAAKMLSVGLHGKFGQRNQRWECVRSVLPPVHWGSWTSSDPDTGRYETWRAVGGVAQKQNSPTETCQNFPVIAAYVCSYARLWMRHVIGIAGPREVYYSDADSVHTSSAGFAAIFSAGLICPNTPGYLKIEGTHLQGEYRGPKNYRLGEAWTRAGVRERTRVDEKGICHDTHFHSLGSILGAAPPEGPLTEEVTFNLPAGKVDGIVGRDGWVRPPRYVEVR